jgi:geranylgeranyl pyrophosphate synthase
VAGFLFSDEPADARETYKRLGNSVGVLFQWRNDCADYEYSAKTREEARAVRF